MIDRFWLDIQFYTLTFYPTTMMHSPAPNIPGAASPFNEYMDELAATSIDDICELDETTDTLFASKDDLIHALSVGGGAASAGCMAARWRHGQGEGGGGSAVAAVTAAAAAQRQQAAGKQGDRAAATAATEQ